MSEPLFYRLKFNFGYPIVASIQRIITYFVALVSLPFPSLPSLPPLPPLPPLPLLPPNMGRRPRHWIVDRYWSIDDRFSLQRRMQQRLADRINCVSVTLEYRSIGDGSVAGCTFPVHWESVATSINSEIFVNCFFQAYIFLYRDYIS